ncbi:MAG TPA: membrane protein insertase YidC [Micromonosporaceae bacterium]|nr:membrane protein insertase YidC [Micromonosporaceae bacterium]
MWSFLPGKAFLGTNWDWILAIVFLVLTVRVVLFPLFVKQIRSQRAMQALAPQIKALQEKHKGDRETLQKEMMELYRKEKANPLMGCLPMFLQVPVFLGLYHVLKRLNPVLPRDKYLYGWTPKQFDSASHARLFDAPIPSHFSSSTADLIALNANGAIVKIVAGALVLIMIVTTFLTSRQMILKTGWSEDPNQRMIQKLMLYGIPASLLISGYLFPIGVVIYWVVQNLFSLGQQFWVLHKYPPPKLATAGAAVAGRTAATKSTTGRTASSRTTAGRAVPGRATKATGTKTAGGKAPAGKLTSRSAGTAKSGSNAEPAVDGKALAPKVGAKPINPKKGGPKAKRPAG